MVQASKNGRHQGLQNLFLVYFADEAQSHATDVLVGMLQVVPEILADEDLRHGEAKAYHQNGVLPWREKSNTTSDTAECCASSTETCHSRPETTRTGQGAMKQPQWSSKTRSW